MQLSPHRTHSLDLADLVWVPAVFFTEVRGFLITSCSSAMIRESAHIKLQQVQVQCQTFMDTALDTLPLLQQKPHLLAISSPMSIFPECLRHPSALNFTFVTPDPWAELPTWSPQLTDLCVGCPTLGHVHWHAGGLLPDATRREAAMPLTLLTCP